MIHQFMKSAGITNVGAGGRWTVTSTIRIRDVNGAGTATDIQHTRFSSKAQARRLVRALVAAGHRGRVVRHGRFRVGWRMLTYTSAAIYYARKVPGE